MMRVSYEEVASIDLKGAHILTYIQEERLELFFHESRARAFGKTAWRMAQLLW